MDVVTRLDRNLGVLNNKIRFAHWAQDEFPKNATLFPSGTSYIKDTISIGGVEQRTSSYLDTAKLRPIPRLSSSF